jgi:hypothetical protein
MSSTGTKITELTQHSGVPASGDLAPIVDDPSGTPETKKITIYDLLSAVTTLIATSTVSAGALPKADASATLMNWVPASGLKTYDFFRNAIYGFDVEFEHKYDNYTFDYRDAGKLITFDSATDVTGTIPSGLIWSSGLGFSVLQLGSGQVVISGSGAVVNNRQSHDRTAGQFATASIIGYTTDTYLLAGDTATA